MQVIKHQGEISPRLKAHFKVISGSNVHNARKACTKMIELTDAIKKAFKPKCD